MENNSPKRTDVEEEGDFQEQLAQAMAESLKEIRAYNLVTYGVKDLDELGMNSAAQPRTKDQDTKEKPTRTLRSSNASLDLTASTRENASISHTSRNLAPSAPSRAVSFSPRDDSLDFVRPFKKRSSPTSMEESNFDAPPVKKRCALDESKIGQLLNGLTKEGPNLLGGLPPPKLAQELDNQNIDRTLRMSLDDLTDKQKGSQISLEDVNYDGDFAEVIRASLDAAIRSTPHLQTNTRNEPIHTTQTSSVMEHDEDLTETSSSTSSAPTTYEDTLPTKHPLSDNSTIESELVGEPQTAALSTPTAPRKRAHSSSQLLAISPNLPVRPPTGFSNDIKQIHDFTRILPSKPKRKSSISSPPTGETSLPRDSRSTASSPTNKPNIIPANAAPSNSSANTTDVDQPAPVSASARHTDLPSPPSPSISSNSAPSVPIPSNSRQQTLNPVVTSRPRASAPHSSSPGEHPNRTIEEEQEEEMDMQEHEEADYAEVQQPAQSPKVAGDHGQSSAREEDVDKPTKTWRDSHLPWTDEEDQRLFQHCLRQLEMGRTTFSWPPILQAMPGRTTAALRQRVTTKNMRAKAMEILSKKKAHVESTSPKQAFKAATELNNAASMYTPVLENGMVASKLARPAYTLPIAARPSSPYSSASKIVASSPSPEAKQPPSRDSDLTYTTVDETRMRVAMKRVANSAVGQHAASASTSTFAPPQPISQISPVSDSNIATSAPPASTTAIATLVFPPIEIRPPESSPPVLRATTVTQPTHPNPKKIPPSISVRLSAPSHESNFAASSSLFSTTLFSDSSENVSTPLTDALFSGPMAGFASWSMN